MTFANVILCFTLGQLPQYPPLPTMPPTVDVEVIPAPKKVRRATYEEMVQRAISEGKPLVVGVNCVPIVPSGFLGYQGEFNDETEETIIVGVPVNGELKRVQTIFNSDVSVGTIRSAVTEFLNQRKAVRLSPTPFSLFDEAQPYALTDDDPIADGRWPTGLEFPKEMQRYNHARFTQRIAITNERDTITPVSRSQTERKWQVPGGLEFAENWTSALYKYVPRDNTDWIGNISVLNELGYFQNNRGWKRSYPVGTYFCDVLTNKKTGKVFEVRYRTKTENGWENDVAYRSPSNRPLGFRRLSTKDCLSCHNTTTGAGTGGYAVGLIPGGDTVISDPFPALER